MIIGLTHRHKAARLVGAVFVLVLTSLALAAMQGVVFRDKNDNMSLRDLSSWKTTRVDDNVLGFRGIGKPFIARWRDQGILVTANSIDGTAVKGASGGYALQNAAISGNVRADITSKDVKGNDRTTNITSAQVQLTSGSDSATAVLTGTVKIVDTNLAVDQKTTMTGSSATVVLFALGKQTDFPIRSATIKGPVKLTMVTHRKVNDKVSQVVLTSTADTLIYNDTARTIELRGNVVLTSDDEVVAGTATAEKATITLTQDRKLKDVELSGTPGTSTLTERGGS